MKSIVLPQDIRRNWISSITDEALPAVLVNECLSQKSIRIHIACFESSRSLTQAYGEMEALIALPSVADPYELEIVELPYLEEYRHLDSVFLDKQCDVIRTLSLISQSQYGQRPSKKTNPNAATEKQRSLLILTTPDALHQPLPKPAHFQKNRINLEEGKEFEFEKLKRNLAESLHYDYEAVCEQPGQFAIRGGIIDVYPVNELSPYRIDFFGDEVDSIKTFDPTTQLTEQTVQNLTILPVEGSPKDSKSNPDQDSETLLSAYLDKPCCWYFRNLYQIETHVPSYFSSPERIKDSNKRKISCFWEERSKGSKDQWSAIDEIPEPSSLLGLEDPEKEPSITPLSDWLQTEVIVDENSPEDASLRQSEVKTLRQLHNATKNGYQVIIGVSKQDEIERYEALIREFIGEKTTLTLVEASLPKGIVFHNRKGSYFPKSLTSSLSKSKTAGVILVSEADLHPYLRIRIGKKKKRKAVEISQVDQMLDFTELSDGDYLVHQTHGVCIFRGIQVMDFASNREVLSLEFAENSMLHVPLTECHMLTRYVGLTKRTPKLGKFGSNQWEKERKAAEKATLELAQELLVLQAKRDAMEGYAFPPDDDWMKQFEKVFPYNETPDQLTAIHQCKSDMERLRPMDRLICGDVGFGKTEVAMRAAFKALEAGKQVALLVPTTVLCQQHYISFKERMAPFPVRIDTVSGFRTPKQQKTALAKVAAGQTDMIVGTHRLLSQDVSFKDLGLMIVDEEHRFGVKQKERLKQIANSVDVLTLSATPIPRTLYMALAGARDLSVIETPPQNRLPIETVVRTYSNQIVDSAIRTEVNRNGQVFYLHNRVSTIDNVAATLEERNPELRVAVGHGQMDRGVLEKIMTRFVNGEYDVMVCTTIIESGLDIPNCNTLIIDGADKFGLAQLYQIRGRVGRFNRQAYAYLLLHGRKPVASIAKKRLSAIKENNELGAGYRIAMRDLELRGAGNILGSAQSGHIAGVGFELYCRLLKQSISRFKGGISGPITRTTVTLDFATFSEPGADETEKSSRKDIKSNFDILKASQENDDWVEPIHAYIPKAYIHETKLRIEFYRKLASAAELPEVKAIRASMKDRFGTVPDETEALIRISAIRCLAEMKQISSVASEKGKLMLKLGNSPSQQYYKAGTHFPRLTKKPPLLLLNDCLNFLSKL